MKALIQRILQYVLGFQTYLWKFTQFKLKRLHKDESEADFFHFVQCMPKKAVVLDIGANLGLMAYFLCKAKFEVHAFEPIPHNLTNLHRLKTHYKLANLHIHPVALGDENGEVELVLPVVQGVLKQGLSHVKHEKMTEFNEGKSFTSAVYRLDDYFKGARLDGIKIDVENFEYEVFKGAQQLINKHKPLIYCELWDNKNRQDCFQFFKTMNYSVQVLHKNQLVSYDSANHLTQNFFFVPND